MSASRTTDSSTEFRSPIPKYMAQTYHAAHPNAQVLGGVVRGMCKNLSAAQIRPLLADINPEFSIRKPWYTQQNMLNTLKAIANAGRNGTQHLIAIGIQGADAVPAVAVQHSISGSIRALEASYKLIHMNVPETEGLFVQWLRSGSALILNNTPYPNDLIYGYIWGSMRRVRPANLQFVVTQTDNPDTLVNPGTAFEITWG